VRRKEFLVSAVALTLCLSAPARAQQPEIPENIKQFWVKLAKAKTITFMAQTWDWEQHQEIAPRLYKRLRQTYEVKIQKPNRIAVLGSPPLVYEIPPDKNTGSGFLSIGSRSNIQISDGKRSLLLDTVKRAYRYAPPLKALDELGGVDPNAPVVFLHLEHLFEKDPMQGFLPLPAASPRNDPGPTYVYPSPNPKLPGEVRIVFDKDTGYLVIIAEWWRTDKGEMREEERLVFHHWDFDPPLPRSTFDTRTPRGYRTMEEWLKELNVRQTTSKTLPTGK
jgi:hypothetical protein